MKPLGIDACQIRMGQGVGAELRQLSEAHERFSSLLRAVPEIRRGIEESLARVRDAVHELAAAASAGRN